MQADLVRCIHDHEKKEGAGNMPDGPATGFARDAIELVVAIVFQVPPAEMRARTRRSARTAFARQVAMYLAHVTCGLTLTHVGKLFERDRTTVAHACNTIEDRRDDPQFDGCMENLEASVIRLAHASMLGGLRA